MAWNFVQHLPGEHVLTHRQKIVIHHLCPYLDHRYRLKAELTLRDTIKRVRRATPTLRIHAEALKTGMWMLQSLYRILSDGDDVRRSVTNNWTLDRPKLRYKINEILQSKPLTWEDVIPDDTERGAFLANGVPPTSLIAAPVWDIDRFIQEYGTTDDSSEERPLCRQPTLHTVTSLATRESVTDELAVLIRTMDDFHRSLESIVYPGDHSALTARAILERVDDAISKWQQTALGFHGTPLHILQRMHEHRRVMRLVREIIERVRLRKVTAAMALSEVRSCLEACSLINRPLLKKVG